MAYKLFIPGPIAVSDKTLRAMAQPMIGHRSIAIDPSDMGIDVDDAQLILGANVIQPGRLVFRPASGKVWTVAAVAAEQTVAAAVRASPRKLEPTAGRRA